MSYLPLAAMAAAAEGNVMKRFNDQRGGRVTSLHRMREAYLVRLFVRRFLFALEADFPVFL